MKASQTLLKEEGERLEKLFGVGVMLFDADHRLHETFRALAFEALDLNGEKLDSDTEKAMREGDTAEEVLHIIQKRHRNLDALRIQQALEAVRVDTEKMFGAFNYAEVLKALAPKPITAAVDAMLKKGLCFHVSHSYSNARALRNVTGFLHLVAGVPVSSSEDYYTGGNGEALALVASNTGAAVKHYANGSLVLKGLPTDTLHAVATILVRRWEKYAENA
jgi:hypothetical protein